jgi:hypothetical protein
MLSRVECVSLALCDALKIEIAGEASRAAGGTSHDGFHRFTDPRLGSFSHAGNGLGQFRSYGSRGLGVGSADAESAISCRRAAEAQPRALELRPEGHYLLRAATMTSDCAGPTGDRRKGHGNTEVTSAWHQRCFRARHCAVWGKQSAGRQYPRHYAGNGRRHAQYLEEFRAFERAMCIAGCRKMPPPQPVPGQPRRVSPWFRINPARQQREHEVPPDPFAAGTEDRHG